MIRLDGTLVAKTRQENLRRDIDAFRARNGFAPGLAVVLVGENSASQIYVRNKVKTTESLGMKSLRFDLPERVAQAELLAKVESLNRDPQVHGILIQLPLPSQIEENAIIDALDPKKDPDGLTPANFGLLWAGRGRVAPCTPSGVMKILEHFKIEVAGRSAVVVGRSNIVGKPMAHLLTQANATVTVCHTQTRSLEEHTRRADLVVVAAGRERMLGRDAFKKGAIVVDVGMHRPTSGPLVGKICGDVRYEELEGWVEAATPVPGGVGPMTIQMLMENTLTLARGFAARG